VKDDWCAYTQLEWTVVDKAEVKGTDFNPQWPLVKLAADQREGDRLEDYTVIFVSDGQEYRMGVSSADQLDDYTPGSRWELKVNALGGVVSAEPAQ
jgi:hypothetical protein